jgi:hypothetical protein
VRKSKTKGVCIELGIVPINMVVGTDYFLR